MSLIRASKGTIMQKKLYIVPIFLAFFSVAVILISLQLDISPEMIVGDSMQARTFPIFLMAVNLTLIAVLSFQFYKKYPKRIYNIGILEQSMISMAAGLSNEGLKPIVHTIAPFIVSRAYEQLKIDFGYNKLNGNFVSIGASYDYASLGCTHHCPEDINLMYNKYSE